LNRPLRNRGLLAQHPEDKVIKLNERLLGPILRRTPSRLAAPAMLYRPTIVKAPIKL